MKLVIPTAEEKKIIKKTLHKLISEHGTYNKIATVYNLYRMTVWRWYNHDDRYPNIEHAMYIKEKSGGKYRLKDLCPQYFREDNA